MSSLLPIPKCFATKSTDVNINATTGEIDHILTAESPWLGDEIVDPFGPPRLPPRVVVKLPGVRRAAGEEINDLLSPHRAGPPAMVEASLNESRFRSVPRIRSTIAVKRKSIGIYKGRLCARCESVPLTHAPFTAIPTAQRCGTKLVLTVAALGGFGIRSVDASQAFPRSDNVAESDRLIVLPPAMVPMPWKGELHPQGVNLNRVPPPSLGFLISKPLYGTRESPLIWFLKLPKVSIQFGRRQVKSDIRMYSRLDSQGVICGFLIVRVDCPLYTGPTEFSVTG